MKNMTKNSLKIAMIGAKGAPAIFGGVERSVDELGGRLAALGYAVTVYSRAWYTTMKKPTYKGMRIVKTPTIHTKHLDAIVHTFTSTIHALVTGTDVIHYHGVGPSLLAWIPRVFAPRVKVVVSFQSIDREHGKWGAFARLMLKLGERAAAKFGHVVLASSFMINQYIKENYGVRAQYFPNGATIPTAVNTDIDAELISGFDLEPNQYIVVVSRLVKHKGMHEVIEAFQKARKENAKAVAGMKLAIVGGGAFTDEYVQELHAMAKNDDSIVFTGSQSGMTLHALMRQARFAIHASHAEGLPMSVLELMGQGTPVLVSDIEPHLEVVQDERWIVGTGDVSGLKTAIIRLALDAEFTESERKTAQDIIAARYTWDRLALKLAHIYDELSDEAPAYGAKTSVA